jgi:hypothetical protein
VFGAYKRKRFPVRHVKTVLPLYRVYDKVGYGRKFINAKTGPPVITWRNDQRLLAKAKPGKQNKYDAEG